ncbi:class I SAM-dependent methyltransferase [Clostridium sporogenes]|jgi:ubiquinone/menaquinone biosynthesis C-methylase UbiE|uniref:class I SAM-dependent methyltransferase n=1 Tax=Clostridium sporogenes TaxID=1509 RepID=UPI0001794391|nr:class I SAM-dependent methyltransferase [Clostridium sporogenes]EDU36134.1 methyltransferase domain protein [Clostridium sporogenes ATCC 15579]MBE6077755.1 class I SAM-dependent methyltransferase [Clostridium lundense]MCW6094134.1 class I SAM-dependent methyltransferase [Clostridium sporogenes]NFE66109.1 class I SAM-dependent methyltransferase [Clostridium sporogenes]
MSKNEENFWEEIYSKGQQLNRYPFDCVVSFIFKNYPRNKQKKDIKILEVGCGAGNNLWFAAREGFNVTGIDISESVIDYAKKRFQKDELKGKFIVGNFDEIANLKEKFDLIIDRAAITNICLDEAKKCVTSIRKALNTDGVMFFNAYSDKHSSCSSGKYSNNGMVTDIQNRFSNIKELYFYGRRDIFELFKEGWKIESIQHTETTEQISPEYFVYADWKVVVRKVGNENE